MLKSLAKGLVIPKFRPLTSSLSNFRRHLIMMLLAMKVKMIDPYRIRWR
jgi:hypothetical protein